MPDRNTPSQTHPDLSRSLLSPTTHKGLSSYTPIQEYLNLGYSSPPQEGDLALCIVHIDCCSGHSFSGTVNAMGSSPVHASHVNDRQPGHGTGQEVIIMMSCNQLSHPEDFKPLIKTAIQIVTSAKDVEDEYASLRFCLAPWELGNGSYPLLGLSPGNIPPYAPPKHLAGPTKLLAGLYSRPTCMVPSPVPSQPQPIISYGCGGG